MEPVQGNGGMIAFPPGYLKRMRELADDFGTLLIFDEIQTGFGRVGEWFASILYEVQPDIMVIGKGLGGGFPLFGTMMDHELQGFQAGDHSFTFAHFSPSMVAALETIKIIEEENLLMRVNVLGTAVQMRLLDMQKKYEFIGDVRGVGLMIGIELVVDRISKCPAPKLTHRIVERALQRGVILGDSKYGGLGNVLKFKPPLNIPEDLAMDALDVLDEIFSTVHEGEIE
jgi:4-aminobutyrate aminotransferase-like enzyme